MALHLCWDQQGRGAFSVSSGWRATAERLLAGVAGVRRARAAGDAPRPPRALRRGRPPEGDGRLRARRTSWQYGSATGRASCVALAGRGRALIKAGDAEKGLALMDEASAGATTGDLESQVKGNIYCMTISACSDLGDYRRAAEWTETANRWCSDSTSPASPASAAFIARRCSVSAANGPRRRPRPSRCARR